MTGVDLPLPLSGYVLAGGKSTRMGRDKALLRFQGSPLVQVAVARLRGFCAEVSILGSRPDLAEYGATLPDRVADAGPLAGIDAAFHSATHEWILLLPVDVPLLPGGLLGAWAWKGMHQAEPAGARCFSVGGRTQPLVALLHRSLAPFVRAALDAGRGRVLPALEEAAARAAALRPRGSALGMCIDVLEESSFEPHWTPTPAEYAMKTMWFANGNTPEEFARIEAAADDAMGKLEVTVRTCR